MLQINRHFNRHRNCVKFKNITYICVYNLKIRIPIEYASKFDSSSWASLLKHLGLLNLLPDNILLMKSIFRLYIYIYIIHSI